MSATQIQELTTSQLNRSDEDLLLRLRIALSVHKRAGWHLVRFTAQDGVVQLMGVVPTFYDRQLIAALIRHVAGVFGIKDNLTVGDPSIRQQVTAAETPPEQSDPTPNTLAHDPFRHVPVLLQSLDDIVVGTAVGVA